MLLWARCLSRAVLLQLLTQGPRLLPSCNTVTSTPGFHGHCEGEVKEGRGDPLSAVLA